MRRAVWVHCLFTGVSHLQWCDQPSVSCGHPDRTYSSERVAAIVQSVLLSTNVSVAYLATNDPSEFMKLRAHVNVIRYGNLMPPRAACPDCPELPTARISPFEMALVEQHICIRASAFIGSHASAWTTFVHESRRAAYWTTSHGAIGMAGPALVFEMFSPAEGASNVPQASFADWYFRP